MKKENKSLIMMTKAMRRDSVGLRSCEKNHSFIQYNYDYSY